MKKKQKKVLMVVLGVAAVILLIVQLGPLLFGKPSPYVDPEKAKKKQKAARAPRRKSTARPARRKRAPSRRRSKKTPGKADAPLLGDLSLEDVSIDLSHIGRRVVVYRPSKSRDPFAAMAFETVKKLSPLETMKFDLQGIVTAGGREAAIIGARVYGEGDVVRPGVRVEEITKSCVVLTDGTIQVRLRLAGSTLKIGRP
jgi:hypothetical protein